MDDRFNLKTPEHSYIFGLFQGDGWLSETTRNRGKLSIELNRSDGKLLYKIKDLLLVKAHIRKRERDTNFKKGHKSLTLTIHDLDFRKKFKELGFVAGKKAEVITIPPDPYCEKDYFRGLIDADGSVGFTGKGRPFLSFTTSSEDIKEGFLSYIEPIIKYKKHLNRNKRDNVYNICVYQEDAQGVSNKLYYDDCLSLKRKYSKAKDILKWNRYNQMDRLLDWRPW